jgi:hypothetical protein
MFSSWYLNEDRISPQTLKEEIFKIPEAIPLYKKSKTQLWLAAGLIIGGGLLAAETNRKQLQPPYNPNRGYIITGGIILSTGVYLLFKSLHNHKKAIKAYNTKKLPV